MTLVGGLDDLVRKSAVALLGEDRARRVSAPIRDVVSAVTYGVDPRGRQSRESLSSIRGAFAGHRCWIIGNGPSLNATDLARLRDECTFGLNRATLYFPRLGHPTTFLVCVNDYVMEQSATELLSAGSRLFVAWSGRRWFPRAAPVTYLRSHHEPSFSTDVADGLWEGATVTYVALQLAYHLGFSDVILVGVDHSFATTGQANSLVTSSGSDANHFDPSYFGAGYRWQLPDLVVSEAAYRMAGAAFERDRRHVRDATVGGKMSVFDKVDFDSITSGTHSAGQLKG